MQTDTDVGIVEEGALPYVDFENFWNAIYVDDSIKNRLLSQAVLNFTLRPKVDKARVPLHGLILLTGRPGTGKTSLAKGLASKTASVISGNFRYLEIDPHALANAGLGRSQQAVRRILEEVVAERASQGPLIVLLDEVEALASDRAQLSLEANPVDVHRATDAAISGLDHLASRYPGILFVATSNFEQAIDGAIKSRADLILKVPLPGPAAAKAIIRDAVSELAIHYPEAGSLLQGTSLDEVAARCVGLDGRQIRKLIVSACTFDRQTATDPRRLTAQNLIDAAAAALEEGAQ